MIQRIISACAAIVAAALIAGPAIAGGTVNTTWSGAALKGYDAVAYHTVGKPVVNAGVKVHHWPA